MKDISPSIPSGQTDQLGPIALIPLFQERIWGRKDLRPYYPDLSISENIGEVWFTYKDNRTSTGLTLGELLNRNPDILGNAANPDYPDLCPLLLKLVITNAPLSVQVHPSDDYAKEHHNSLGKTEAWYVADAHDAANVAIGFRETLTATKLKEAALSGEIETLLNFQKVSKGDLIYVPAGAVHAIGAGLTICEIQENSDITYRLYDYGRPRELHLEHGIKVSNLGPQSDAPKAKRLSEGREQLFAGGYFRIEKLTLASQMRIGRAPFYMLLICLAGDGTLNKKSCRLGDAYLIPANSSEVILDAAGSEWILTYTAAEALAEIV